ncbi:MAG: response regulator, partial [Spartobacteria bacterium]|nr:response regulator [Spartobacteria bacterium]
AAKRSAAIIQDLLVLSRRSTRCVAPVMVDQVVASYLQSAGFRDLQDRFPEVSIEVRVSEEPLMVMGSVSHLTQVVMNLVINAFEVIKGPGEVTLECRRVSLDEPYGGFEPIPVGEYCMLTVSDSGTGIPAEDIEHIFEPFFSKKILGQSGTGLGLAVVYGVVKDMDGYVDVFGQEGEGAEFSIYLPITNESATTEQEESIDDYAGNESILMLDDEPAQRDVARRLLERMGYRVHTVGRFKEALAYFKENIVDLVILDMILGGHYDGMDVYRELHKINPDVKCIIVSGFSASDRVKEAQQLGAGMFVQKPYTTIDIGKAVRQTLDADKDKT